ncbi:MAG: hypothetical protein V1659_02505 [Candidatus Woesearchaeota archaeon]
MGRDDMGDSGIMTTARVQKKRFLVNYHMHNGHLPLSFAAKTPLACETGPCSLSLSSAITLFGNRRVK